MAGNGLIRARKLAQHICRPREDHVVVERGSLLIGTIVVASGLIAFATVRALFVPMRAAAVTPAMLTVDTEPAGASLLIDSQPRGTTPETLTIDPGEHTVLVRLNGAERTLRLSLGSGARMAQYLDLRPKAPVAVLPGRLSIVTEPSGARVIVDGRSRGVSPLVIDDLAPAAHNVTVTSDTGSAQQTITVTDGVTKEVVFSLPRSQAPLGGWLSVASPFPVDVIERDEVVGTSGTARTMLPAGSHDLVLRNDSVGYEGHYQIDVKAGGVATLEVVPPKGSLNINARPWADVLIDGARVGQTPIANLLLPVGTHQITFRHPQLGERRESVLITAKEVNRIAVDLSK